jgi:glycosyltransferase involved in cell wall biosynthesis
LDPNKGLEVLLPAFGRVQRQRPEARLLLAGPDERGYRAQLEQLVQALGLEESVTFAGYLSGELRLAAFGESQAYVLPSRYEGLSMALLEALYNGLPAITTPYVGLAGRLEELDCARVTPLEEGSLQAQMEFILQNPDQAREMGERGRQLILREHNWDAIAERLLAQLESHLPQG